MVSLRRTEPRMYNCIFTEHRATDVQLYLYEAKIHKCTIVSLRSTEPRMYNCIFTKRRATNVQLYLYGAQSHGCTIVSLPSTEPRMYNCIFTEHRATDVQLYLYEAKIHKCTIVFLQSVEPQTWSFIFTKRFHVRLLLSCSMIILILTIVGSLRSVLLPLEESVCHWKRSRCQISTIPVACKECPTVGPRSNLHL